MIGSFWNLCRACPSMPVDKLHSEYRSTYRWHEYTGGPESVVKKPPVPNQFASSKADHFFSKSTEEEKYAEASTALGTANEPPLPRRKKCPELAYRSHEFMSSNGPAGAGAGVDRTDSAINNNRARSDERGTPSRRSKSAGPPGLPNGRLPSAAVADALNGDFHIGEQSKKTGESSGLFKKTISKFSTEYRLQFVWPRVRSAIKIASDDVCDPPRKSLSMGAIKPTMHQQNAIATIHKKRTTNEKEATAHELEPLVNDTDDKVPVHHEKREFENKKNRSDREKYGFEPDNTNKIDNKIVANGGIPHTDNAWYKEVIELRKKAGEYKNRGWGCEINPDLYNKQVELWDQVSRRSSLSALSLASTVRPITKEEKEKENNKKSSPTKPFARGRVPGQARPVEINKNVPEAFFGRLKKDAVRHHLERTTGADVEEGALLPSPTREKLMPTIPRSKGDSPQRGSPQKTALSRHGSPQKVSGRSQSVGPIVAEGGGSPKRQIRAGSSVTASTASSAAKTHKKPGSAAPSSAAGERKPRPTTLSTTNHSRSKSSSLPPFNGTRVQSAPFNTNTNLNSINSNPNANANAINPPNSSNASAHLNAIANPNATAKASPQARNLRLNLTSTTATNLSPNNLRKPVKNSLNNKQQKLKASMMTTLNGTETTSSKKDKLTADHKKTAENEDADEDECDNEYISNTCASPHSAGVGAGPQASQTQPPQQQLQPEIAEHVIKSPPEPTRVKSPEQIIMRSPDPVNWTVPLDTGKTFTVTQNVRDGDHLIRPNSEFKASTPLLENHPILAPQSAPPELAEQSKMNDDTKSINNIIDDKLPYSASSLMPDDTAATTIASTSSSSPAGATLTASSPTAAAPASIAVAAAAVVAVTAFSASPATSSSSPSMATVQQPAIEPEVSYVKPVPGSTLRCLEDPSFDTDINSPSVARNLIDTEVLDKARDRFDRFWGNNKDDEDGNL